MKPFRLTAVALSLLVSVLATAAVYGFNPIAAKGLLGGGMAGTLAFWIVARRVEKLASQGTNSIESAIHVWTFLRMGLFAITLWWAYTLDRDTLHGVIAAACGLFINIAVLAFLGVTGLDQKLEKK